MEHFVSMVRAAAYNEQETIIDKLYSDQVTGATRERLTEESRRYFEKMQNEFFTEAEALKVLNGLEDLPNKLKKAVEEGRQACMDRNAKS